MEVELRIVSAALSASGEGEDDLASLWSWLADEDELRGRVDRPPAAIGETDLGGLSDLVTVSVGSASGALAVARVLVAWIESRRSPVKVSVTVGEETVTVEAGDVREVRPLLEGLLRPDDAS